MDLLHLLFVACACRFLSPVTAVDSPWRSSRIAIAVSESFDDGRFNHPIDIHFTTKGTRSKAVYAARHGYDLQFIVHKVEGGNEHEHSRHINWNKVYWTRRVFAGHQGEPVCAKYDWVVWMDNDIFITNGSVTVQDIIEAGRAAHGGTEYPHFIANRDAAGAVNTGVALVRCSRQGLRLLNFALAQRGTEATNERVRAFDHNGAIWWGYDNEEWIRSISALVPPKLVNAYAWQPRGGTEMVACPDAATCDRGYWSPGDWLIHFAGGAKGCAADFLRQFPPSSWVGYEGDLTYA